MVSYPDLEARLARARERLHALDRNDGRAFWVGADLIEDWVIAGLNMADRKTALEKLGQYYRELGVR